MWDPEWKLDWAACRELAIARRKRIVELEAERDALLRRTVCFYGLSDDLVYAQAVANSGDVEGCGELGVWESIVSFRLEPSGDVFRLRYGFGRTAGGDGVRSTPSSAGSWWSRR
jgi:hypothetical protein